MLISGGWCLFGSRDFSFIFKGNGAAIKSGARAAKGNVLGFMDADGQHKPEDIPVLLGKLAEGVDMVVGARTQDSQAGMHRGRQMAFTIAWPVGWSTDFSPSPVCGGRVCGSSI